VFIKWEFLYKIMVSQMLNRLMSLTKKLILIHFYFSYKTKTFKGTLKISFENETKSTKMCIAIERVLKKVKTNVC